MITMCETVTFWASADNLKGTVHPKMKILSLITHYLHVSPNPITAFLLLNVSVALLSMQGQKSLGFH